jgi:hypothetical protein
MTINREPWRNQHSMKAISRLVALSLLVAAPALASPHLELEGGAGVYGWSNPWPVLTARAGIDLFDWFTPSLRVTSASPVGFGQSEWAVLGEFRAHSRGTLQVNGGLGVGLGTAKLVANPFAGVNAQVASVAPYLVGDIGVRVMIGRAWVGANVGGAPISMAWLATLNVGVSLF